MSIPSNLYAEKVFAEHPATLWALDDKADYLSLILESRRNLSSWVTTGGTATVVTDVVDEPFANSFVSKLSGNVPTDDSGQIVCVSPSLGNFSIFDSELATFSIGGYFYSLNPYVSGFEIGYQYRDEASGQDIEKLKQYSTSISGHWIFISETFDIPYENADIKILLKINYISGGDSPEDYEFLVNGITLGQWCEEFNSTSLGVQKIDIIDSISGSYPGRYGIEAVAYGLEEKSAYYLVSNNKIAAKNTGIPMVYGASSLTKLIPNNGQPSLIVPGSGFLNEEGRYKEQTLEMWIRINSDSTTKKRIVGPIGSTDGLYVDGPFIILKISDNFQSYYIGEWTRPMLLDIRLKDNLASVLINGDEVINLPISSSEISLPSKLDSNSNDQDWIGFYAYDDVSPVEVDCIAIYPYEVPSLVARRRFVYGQGVEFPEGINQAYSGSSIYIDYPFADYTNNYSYPDLGNWSQGIVDNLSLANNALSTPDYVLPDIVLSSSNLETLYSYNADIQDESDPLFTFKPEDWDNIEGHMFFKSLNFLNEGVKSFHGIFKVKEFSTDDQVLFHLQPQESLNSFSIVLNNNNLFYKLKYGSTEETIYQSYNVQLGEQFCVALDIDTFSNYFGGNVASFFGNPGSLKLYVGGTPGLTNTFAGNIYTVGFSNARNHQKFLDIFNEIGTAKDYENLFNNYIGSVGYDAGNSYFGSYLNELGNRNQEDVGFWQYVIDGGTPTSYSVFRVLDTLASYSLVPTIVFDSYSLDINANCYWEDYIPLTYFSQYVTDAKGDSYYDLDFIQFNINYPSPSKFLEEEQSGSWTYEELQAEYSNPIQRTYASLDNQLFTGYLDYTDLQNKVQKKYKYDTFDSLVRTYVSFQYVADGANAPEGYFLNMEFPPKESIIEPGTNWMNTKYEVINNMIIYPPKTADASLLALVTHIEFNVRGILKNKVNIKTLEYASQAFNDVEPNPVGTRFGTSIYPYKKSGAYLNYKDKNPFTIYKGSSPYLYLTRYSGIELKGTYDPMITRGLLVPVNETKSSNYKVLALQTAIRFDQDFFPYAPTEIFEIESKDAHIKFFMVANHPSGKRAKIYAIDALTGRLEDNIGFYWNGKIVKEPSITIKEWGFLGISFPTLLDFSNTVGSIRLNGPIMFNTISYYQSTNLQEVTEKEYRLWFSVKASLSGPLEWDFWKTAPYLWQGVLVKSLTSYYGVDPSTIYNSYTGTNKIIIDTDKVLTLNSYNYSVYQDISWTQSTINAV